MFGRMLENVRREAPLVHNITNYVTVNDCANIVLACGASPIMADDLGEVADVTALCKGLNINIGTLNQGKVPAILAAGKRANELNRPVVFDPVGAGASQLRTKTALQLLDEIRFSVIRGNLSEIRALAYGIETTHGVDAELTDKITEEHAEEIIGFVKAFAQKTGAVIAVTGAIDLVTDGEAAYCIRNGHPMMSRITGTGCMLSALTAAFAAANPEQILEAAAAAVAAMGLCGEIAKKRLSPLDGNASYRNYIIDAVYNLTPEELERGANYELRQK